MSLGTLISFIVVSTGVIILCVCALNLPRTFKVPDYPVTSVLAVLACGYHLVSLLCYNLDPVQPVVALTLDLLPGVGSLS